MVRVSSHGCLYVSASCLPTLIRTAGHIGPACPEPHAAVMTAFFLKKIYPLLCVCVAGAGLTVHSCPQCM